MQTPVMTTKDNLQEAQRLRLLAKDLKDRGLRRQLISIARSYLDMARSARWRNSLLASR